MTVPWRAVLALAAGLAVQWGCRGGEPAPEVVVYTSVDQPRAESVLEAFEEATGIRTLAVYDVEASKTTGLANRLLAEAERPRADVFWSSEVIQTVWLAGRNVLASYDSPVARDVSPSLRDPEGRWTGMGLRSRVILVNTDLVRDRETPRTLTELLTGPSAASAGMALPLFGTSFTHAAVLFSHRGSGWTEALYQNAVAGGVRILDGNARVAALVVHQTLTRSELDTFMARTLAGLLEAAVAAGAGGADEEETQALPRVAVPPLPEMPGTTEPGDAVPAESSPAPVCPACGRTAPPDARFCGYCGSPLQG